MTMLILSVLVWVVLGIGLDLVMQRQGDSGRLDHTLVRVLAWPALLAAAVARSSIDAFIRRVSGRRS